jgi:hypothetical protein
MNGEEHNFFGRQLTLIAFVQVLRDFLGAFPRFRVVVFTAVCSETSSSSTTVRVSIRWAKTSGG